MLKKAFLLVLLCILIFGAVSAVSADQYGEEQYGFSDRYGVYVYDIDGNQIYLWFWSEWARQQIMGDLTAPGDHVMERPASAPDGKFSLGFAKPESKAAAASGDCQLVCECSFIKGNRTESYGSVKSCASTDDLCNDFCKTIDMLSIGKTKSCDCN